MSNQSLGELLHEQIELLRLGQIQAVPEGLLLDVASSNDVERVLAVRMLRLSDADRNRYYEFVAEQPDVAQRRQVLKALIDRANGVNTSWRAPWEGGGANNTDLLTRLAAGDADAGARLFANHWYGRDGFPRDLDEAMRWMLRAAELSADSKFDLAGLIFKGGVFQKPDGLAWLREAAVAAMRLTDVGPGETERFLRWAQDAQVDGAKRREVLEALVARANGVSTSDWRAPWETSGGGGGGGCVVPLALALTGVSGALWQMLQA